MRSVVSKDGKLTLLPNCWKLRETGFHFGFKLLSITSVLQIGIEPPVSTILDTLRKGSYTRKNNMKSFKNLYMN